MSWHLTVYLSVEKKTPRSDPCYKLLPDGILSEKLRFIRKGGLSPVYTENFSLPIQSI